MADTEITDRFVIEISQVGTVDHIVDLEADSVDRSAYAPRRELPGEKLCDRSTRSPASEYIELRDYADWNDLDKKAFEGDALDEVCSYCWAAILEEIEQVEQDERDGIDERIGTGGYRFRWKQEDRAHEEWYDIVSDSRRRWRNSMPLSVGSLRSMTSIFACTVPKTSTWTRHSTLSLTTSSPRSETHHTRKQAR